MGRMQKTAKMMKGEAVKPLRHNVNCSAAIFGRPQLGHFKAQGRAIFSLKYSKKNPLLFTTSYSAIVYLDSYTKANS